MGRGRRLLAILVLAWSLTATLAGGALAAAGDLDISFGGDGKVGTNFTPQDDWAAALAIQADGKIVAVGSAGAGSSFALARYNPNGTLDTSFDGDGKVTTSFPVPATAGGVAIQADGKIVVAGATAVDQDLDSMFALARYNLDGTLDTSFDGDGEVMTDFTSGSDGASDVAIQADGKIVAAGFARAGGEESRFGLARYNPDGTLDTTFSGDGKVMSFSSGFAQAQAVAIQADGKIVAAGGRAGDFQSPYSQFALARYRPNGKLDGTFSGDGKLLTSFTNGYDAAFDVAIQANGKIVAAGRAGGSGGRFALARYRPDGSLDATFSGNGKVITNFTYWDDEASGLAIQANGKIVAVGWARARFALARYSTKGALDTTFGGDGKVTTNFTNGYDAAFDVAIQANGKIVAAGRAGGSGGRFALARYRAA